MHEKMTDQPPEMRYVVCVDNHTEGLGQPFIVFKTKQAAETFVRRADVYGMVFRKIVEAEYAE